MKKILVAMDNEDILNDVKSIDLYEVYDKDISYKEGVLEYLSKNQVDYILTKDTLEGEMTKEIFIKQIKLVAPKTKIIIFVQSLDDIYKSFLFANEVFNIVEQKQITRKLLEEIIEDKNSKVIYKITETEGEKSCKENGSKGSYFERDDQGKNVKLVTKQTLAVFGTSGAGKSYVSNVISNIIGKNLGLETLMLDLDIQNGSADIYNNLKGGINGLSEIINEIDNNSFTSQTFNKHVNKENNKNNVSYVTNNSSLFECQSKLANKYYERILTKAKSNFDVVVIDTPNSIFLDVTHFSLTNADTIIFVINPNYISIRQSLKYLDLMINVWNIQKEKIFLVVNRVKKASLGKKQIESLMPDIKIKLQIQENQNIESILNELSSIKIDQIDNLNSVYEIFGKNIFQQKLNKKQSFKKLFEKIGVGK